MRRFLLIFFIFALPLQFTWGASARYCAHETAVSVSHFGHHAHVHKAAATECGNGASQSGYDDADCGYCHMGCAQPLPSTALSLPIATQSIYIPPETPPLRFRVPDLIERPNWSLAV